MANYTTSALTTAQAKISAMLQSAELRFRNPAVFKSLLGNVEFFIQNFNELKTRDDRTIDAFYFKKTSDSLGSNYSHNHTGTTGDSGTFTPSWTTKHHNFSITQKQGDKNVFQREEMYFNELQRAIRAFANGMETIAANFLFSSKSGVNVATHDGTFNATTDVFEIDESQDGNRSVQITTSVMNVNNWSGDIIYCDPKAYNRFMYMAAQGIQNATNMSFQFNGVEFILSPELGTLAIALGYTKGFWLSAQYGTFGALTWIPKQNREGLQTSVNKYGTFLNPVDGVMYATHTYEERADGSGIGGYLQDVLEQNQIFVSYSMDVAPLSTPDETPILAFGLV